MKLWNPSKKSMESINFNGFCCFRWILIHFWWILSCFDGFRYIFETIFFLFNQFRCDNLIGFQEFGSKKLIRSQYIYPIFWNPSLSQFNGLSFISSSVCAISPVFLNHGSGKQWINLTRKFHPITRTFSKQKRSVLIFHPF